MNRKFKTVLFALFLLLAFALWRILASAGELPSGSAIDQWNVAGLSRAEAAQLVQKEAQPQPLRILGPRTQSFTLDMRPRAKEAAREAWQEKPGNLWSRVLGTGGSHVKLQWQYSEKDLQKIAQQIAQQEKLPLEAQPVWNDLRLRIRPGQWGWRVPYKKLLRDLRMVARSGGGSLRIPLRRVRPEILSSKEYWKKRPTQLLVDQSDYTLYRYKRGKLVQRYRVAVGQPGFETPNGLWTILERTEDPAWLPPDWAGEQAGILVPGGTPENPLVSRWMGIGDGVGIHGTRDTWSLGSAASHGCIRMDPEEVKALYEYVPLGTHLLIRA